MNNDGQEIENLWALQKAAAEELQALADQMASLPADGVIVPQERWDQLVRGWNKTNERMQEIGRALMKAYGLQT